MRLGENSSLKQANSSKVKCGSSTIRQPTQMNHLYKKLPPKRDSVYFFSD